MALSVIFTQDRDSTEGKRFLAAEVVLDRQVGRPVLWRSVLHVLPEAVGEEEIPELAAWLEAGPVYTQPLWDDKPLGIAALVTGLSYQDNRRTLLRVEAQATYPEQSEQDPFAPRRRVHLVKDLAQLFRDLEPVIKIRQAVRNAISDIAFPDPGHAAIIQDHWSDWAFAHHALRQYHELQQDAELKRLAVSGSLDSDGGTEGKWVVDWADAKAYERLGKKRIADLQGDGGFDQLFFSQVAGYRRPTFPSGTLPAVIHQRVARTFEHQTFVEWTRRDVPVFLGEGGPLVLRVEDILRQGGSQEAERTTWATRLHAVPKGAPLFGVREPAGELPFTSWRGFGEVVDSSPKGPWIKVKLAGFEQGADQLDVRLTTIYAGTDGTKGWHLAPETGTRVHLAWSGRFGDAVLCIGNLRTEPADLASPSIWLEKTLLVRTAETVAEDLGPVTVKSEFYLGLEQSSRIRGDDTMELDVDGTDVRLANGVFYTGKA